MKLHTLIFTAIETFKLNSITVYVKMTKYLGLRNSHVIFKIVNL